MVELPSIHSYALSDADYDQLEHLMRGIVSLGAETAWIEDRTGTTLAIADRTPPTTCGTAITRVTMPKLVRRALTDVEVAVAFEQPLTDIAKLAVLLLAIDDVFIPHRRDALGRKIANHRSRSK